MITTMRTVPKACVYCGDTSDLTHDHIPPKSLFNKPRPSNLITVWACRKCNKAFSKDDDYFWLTLASRAETGRNPDATQAGRRVIHHLSRDEAAGFRQAFLETVQPVEVTTPAGVYVGNTLAYDVSFARLNATASRITRGLFCVETKTLLPTGYIATARAIEGFSSEAGAALQRLLAFIADAPTRSVGRVFRYRFRPVSDDPASSLTLFDIYESTTFVGLTINGGDTVWTERV